MASPEKDSRRTPLPEGPFDLVIVGGGINGAALARDAVLRGHSVCLLEKDDFGAGTSSRSSKMLHGGMRYLEQFRLGLVFEALRERRLQLRLAPHLTRPQAFVIPVYEHSKRGLLKIRIGVALYDLLALGQRLGRGRMLRAEEVTARVPDILTRRLLGGGLYFDGVMDDARLCLENVLDALDMARPGHFFARSYCHVERIVPSAPAQIDGHDRLLDRPFRIYAHRVVRAVGPWTDLSPPRADAPPILAPSKGVHLVLPPLEGDHGLLLTHSRDGRVFFVIPWHGKTLVGTTETPFDGNPDNLRVEPDEVEYLLGELRATFPSRTFERSDILATTAGVRPLARSGSGRSRGKISRKHRLVSEGSGVWALVGGKYTNYRAVAQHVLDEIAPGETPCQTRRRPLPGGAGGPWESWRPGASRWIDRHGEAEVERLFRRYGCRLEQVLELVESEPSLGERLHPDHAEIAAEVVHGVRREEVHYPADFLVRRTDLRFEAGNGRDVYDRVEELIRDHAAKLGAVAPDLEAARRSYFDDLEHEDTLRRDAGAPAPAEP